MTKTENPNKELMKMKKVLCVLAIAVALTMLMTATAFADHSPSFFIKWDAAGGFQGANAAVPSPHNGYVEGTQKCAVCHAVHRAPVATSGWVNKAANATYGTPANPDPTQPDGMLPFPAEAGGTNRATRQIYVVPAGTNTQMLLQSDVAGACDYCHITTSIGGEQIYAGAVKYRLEATSGAGGSNWEGGFAHNNSCTACHAVHGAFANPFVVGATAADNVVFQGAAAPKVLKAYAKNKSTTWETAVVYAGPSAALAGKFAAPGSVLTTVNVPADNVPLFASPADALAGTNVRIGADVADAQVTAFCTFCHENYGYASEATLNPQWVGASPASITSAVGTSTTLGGENYNIGKGLFQGPWIYNGYSARGTIAAGGLDGHVPIKNHPMKSAETTAFFAAGGSAVAQAAFANADTCRTCHDAGVEEFEGVMIQSWPHFTPGYFKFVKSADYLGDTMTHIDADLSTVPTVAAGDAPGLTAIQTVLDDPLVIEDAMTTSDGACLKCHVNAAQSAGVGKTF